MVKTSYREQAAADFTACRVLNFYHERRHSAGRRISAIILAGLDRKLKSAASVD
jgi:hypothetical protein